MPILFAPEVMAEVLEELEDYGDHRSKLRRQSLELRHAIQKTDDEFRRYETTVENFAGYLASLGDTVIDTDDLALVRIPYSPVLRINISTDVFFSEKNRIRKKIYFFYYPFLLDPSQTFTERPQV